MTAFARDLRVFQQGVVNMFTSPAGSKTALVVLTLAAQLLLPRPAQSASLVTFPQGVASGDVTPFSAVLWTRVRPAGANATGQEVTLEVALDSGFRRIHFRRTVSAQPDDDFEVGSLGTPLQSRGAPTRSALLLPVASHFRRQSGRNLQDGADIQFVDERALYVDG